MNRRLECLSLSLPVCALSTVFAVALSAGCELAVNINPAIDGSVSDVIDCGICADVSADANYDAADVSIYGLMSGDAGSDARRGETDAKADAKD